MNKISRIAHIADIHIRKTPTRNDEYEKAFKNLINSLKKEKPDRIIIVGDLVHDYLDLQGEQLILANELLNDLSKIAPVRVTHGNHDMRKKNIKRINSVKAIVKTLNNSEVIYYEKTGVYYDENIAWFVWGHGESKNNPWKIKEGKIFEKLRINGDYVAIDLFHDPINGCISANGFEMKSKSYYKLNDFKGDYGFFGDIHKMQYLNKEKTIAYPSSLIAQDFGEGDNSFHGYLLWNITDGSCKEIPIDNDYSFKNVMINQYTDFDDLDFEIENPTKYMKVRFLWKTLPQTRTNKENERKLIEYIKNKYDNVTISHKNDFIEDNKVNVNETITLNNINDQHVQQEIFKEYLEKIGTDKEVINDIIKLDDEVLKLIDIPNDSGVEWDVVKFGANNFMSYEQLEIDWRNLEGLFQITGINTAGKTTILKLISYLLFGKALETETRIKYGDKRFVNNRNGASFTEGFLVIEANGEYYGIKKKTEIIKNKSGEITSVPTTLSYYLLSTPDDEMNDDSSLEKFDEDRRIKTQQKIDEIIGSYENFKRIVLTTSDTLNNILKNDMAEFIDSLLYDSGLDIFDKKLEGIKKYTKDINNKSRITCNVEATNSENTKLREEIKSVESENSEIEKIKLPDIKARIKKGKEFVEEQTRKLYKIDPEIYNLDVSTAKYDIDIHEKEKTSLMARKSILDKEIKLLKETYDEERLNELLEKKETHRTTENNLKFEIKNIERNISDEQHKIEIINGEIFRLKENGKKLKDEVNELKESKICPTCGQKMTKEHIEHISKLIEKRKKEIFDVVDMIESKEKEKQLPQQKINDYENEIVNNKSKILTLTNEMEDILVEIGTLTNEKNDVEKRKTLQVELDNIPNKIENLDLKISIINQNIINHENSKLQISENQITDKKIEAGKNRLEVLEDEEKNELENILINKGLIAEKQNKIKANDTLIKEFQEQEYQDMILNLYKKCVHRDGIPKQMLSNYILPKINVTLQNILTTTQFKVWLDEDDFRPKLAYTSRPDAIIDCISASGKERTFAAIVLKFALNQINVKSKPQFFLLDEVMGKLSEDSVEEFIEILQLIKNNMRRVLIIEHNAEVNPDYLINVTVDNNGISSLNLE